MSASIPSTILRAVLVAAGLLPAACNGVPQEVTTLGSSDSGDASTSSGPAMASSSSGHDSTATGSSSSSGSSSSGSSADSTGSTSGSTTDAISSSSSDSSSSGSSGSSGSSSSDSGSTDSGSTDSGTSDSGSTGGDTGYCAPTCVVVADCVQPGGNLADWTCTTDGFCEFVGVPPPCDPMTCPAAAGLVCADVDGVSTCVIPCVMSGSECDLFGFACTGVTDMGDGICEPPPCGGAAEGDPCIIMGLGQYGTCTGGACTCVADAECTGPGLACNL